VADIETESGFIDTGSAADMRSEPMKEFIKDELKGPADLDLLSITRERTVPKIRGTEEPEPGSTEKPEQNLDAPNSDETTMAGFRDEFKLFWDEFEKRYIISEELAVNVSSEYANIIQMFFFDIQEAVREFSGKIKQ